MRLRVALPLVLLGLLPALPQAGCVSDDDAFENQPPTLSILSPGSGASAQAGEPIVFQIAVQDDLTPLSEMGLSLTSDLEGELPGTLEHDGNSAAVFTARDGLSILGTHVVTASVVDAGGEREQDSVTIVVTGNAAPEVRILEPVEGGSLYYVDVWMAMRGTVDDPDGDEDGTAITWTVYQGAGDPGTVIGTDAPDSAGEVEVSWQPPAAGAYTVELVAIDAGGLAGSDVRQFTVQACADVDGDGFDCTVDCDDGNTAVHPGAAEACNGVDDDCDLQVDEGFDADGDGFTSCGDDCDDTDPQVSPAQGESCNGVDDDCDGAIDDGLTFYTWYADTDGDGHGDAAATTETCDGVPPPGFVAAAGDCDDTAASVFPGNAESCDGVDNDCDGTPDEGLVFADWWLDGDGDGFGQDGAVASTCDGAPPGHAGAAGDCDDTLPSVHPGAADVCDGVADNDCDGAADPMEADADVDGISACGGDCDDADAVNYPGNPELCDGADNDCDAVVDNGVAFADYRPDADLDGFGDSGAEPVNACDGGPGGYVADGTDCDDTAPAVNPGAAEACNGIDDDCDGAADDGIVFVDYYLDADADGHGNAADVLTACDGAPVGYAALGDDCDDADPANFPGNPELCDAADNDCDAVVDNGIAYADYWPDADLDGFGDSGAEAVNACDGGPGGYVTDGTDCDDAEPAVNPGATEACNGIDDDCDGAADDGIAFVDYYLDADADGHGNAADVMATCDGAPEGYAALGDDCDDADPANFPGNVELCDAADNDCDAVVDNGIAYADYWPDADLDGFGDSGAEAVNACDGGPGGYVTDGTDCDDAEPAVNPGATEACNGIDDDCDGAADDGIAFVDYYLDADADGHGNAADVMATCDGAPEGYAALGDDCDDADPANFPGNVELCDAADNDCDAVVDNGIAYADYWPDA
ncbi:putative metal-binding motif-containing protein, partial [Myxococcota bacterium]|nr:putative metal-binding motif-containing protein [Myxococcota bacterium]